MRVVVQLGACHGGFKDKYSYVRACVRVCVCLCVSVCVCVRGDVQQSQTSGRERGIFIFIFISGAVILERTFSQCVEYAVSYLLCLTSILKRFVEYLRV